MCAGLLVPSYDRYDRTPAIMLNSTYIAVRRAAVFVIGGTILLIGVIMLVTPGPGLLVIPAGLALLATEFLWARRLLARLKEKLPGRESPASSSPEKADPPPDRQQD